MSATLPTATEPKKKRKASKSPTARTLNELRSIGYFAQTVEQQIPNTFIKRDLFGCIDIVAVHPSHRSIVGIQATSAAHHAERRKKAMIEPRLRAWLQAGGRFVVYSWRVDAAGKNVPRIEDIELSDLPPKEEADRLYAEAQAREAEEKVIAKAKKLGTYVKPVTAIPDLFA